MTSMRDISRTILRRLRDGEGLGRVRAVLPPRRDVAAQVDALDGIETFGLHRVDEGSAGTAA